jgi:nucleoside-diphosphate kinase
MKEQTLVIIKPDGMKRGLVGEILTRFEKIGLKVVAMKMLKASDALAGEHYIADEDWMEMVGRKTRENYEKKGLEMKRTNKEHGVN